MTLLAFDERSGALRNGARLDCALAGAELVTLIRERRIDLRGGRVIVLDETPTNDRLLDGSVATMTLSAELPWTHVWLRRRSFGLRGRYLSALREDDVIVEERFRRFGLLPGRRLRVAPNSGLDEVGTRLRMVSAAPGDRPGDDAFAALVQLAGLGNVVFRGPEGRVGRTLLAEISKTLVAMARDDEADVPLARAHADQPGEEVSVGATCSERAAVLATHDAVQHLPTPPTGGSGRDRDIRNAIDLSITLRDGL